jgi:hypothetical protein
MRLVSASLNPSVFDPMHSQAVIVLSGLAPTSDFGKHYHVVAWRAWVSGHLRPGPSQKLLVAVVLARALTEPGEPRSVKPSTHEPFQLVLSPGYHSLVRLT